MRKPEDAPPDSDVIGIDNHGFVGRYRRNGDGGWVPFCRHDPLFDDADMAGWINLPAETGSEALDELIERLASDIADETQFQAELTNEQRSSLFLRCLVRLRDVSNFAA